MPKEKTTKHQETKKSSEVGTYNAVGRRREATARVRLYVTNEGEVTIKDKVLKKGEMIVNGREIGKYFPGMVYKSLFIEPLKITNSLDRFAVSAIISGGGLAGQLGAFVHGLSRALEKVDKEKYRPLLKKRGFLMRDPRAKQRRKAGFAQKARARKQSPKR